MRKRKLVTTTTLSGKKLKQGDKVVTACAENAEVTTTVESAKQKQDTSSVKNLNKKESGNSTINRETNIRLLDTENQAGLICKAILRFSSESKLSLTAAQFLPTFPVTDSHSGIPTILETIRSFEHWRWIYYMLALLRCVINIFIPFVYFFHKTFFQIQFL